MKRIFFRTDYTKSGKKFEYFIEFEDNDIERVKRKEFTIDEIADFTFGIACCEEEKRTVVNFVLKEKMNFGNFRVFIEECYETNLLHIISRQMSI